jgi:ribosomal protein S18 acetylase RimI-like enzyme
MDELAIRRLNAGALDLVEPLWNALREHHVAIDPGLGPPRSRRESWKRRRAQYEAWLSEPDSFVLLAERERHAVGYAMTHLRAGSPTWPLSERAGELETLSVLPAERGRGVGSALLGAVREQLHALGVTELSLHVLPANGDTLRFYEHQGFGTFALWLTQSLD